jgi:PAS domain S-box-containing protein
LPAHERAHSGGQGNSQIPAVDSAYRGPNLPDSRNILERVPCGLVVLDAHGKISAANPAFCDMVGRPESSLQQLSFQNLLPTGGQLFYENQFIPTLLLRGSLAEIAFDLKRADGSHIPVLLNARMDDTDSSEHQILIAMFAVEQRHRYERELIRARKEFEQMAEVVRRSSDAILRLTADGTIQSWNAGAQQIFGLPSEAAIGKPLSSLLLTAHVESLSSAMAKLKGGQEAFIEARGRAASGNEIDLSVSMTPHMEAPGIFVAFSAIIRDITNRKQSERALLQNEKLASVGRLASSIAHEINNPLEAVTNLLYLLQLRVDDEETTSLVTKAQRELDRVAHIATHTLRFHKQSSDRTEVDLHSVAGSVLALYQVRFENSGITVINDSANVSPFLCFEGELRQILFNLVSNAFDSMRAGGRLILRCRDIVLHPSRRRGIRITVADTGSGMNREILRQVFEPFFSTKGIGGTGLGMWITKDLVKKNGGTIRVRSCDRSGRSGTTVVMVFPNEPQ